LESLNWKKTLSTLQPFNELMDAACRGMAAPGALANAEGRVFARVASIRYFLKFEGNFPNCQDNYQGCYTRFRWLNENWQEYPGYKGWLSAEDDLLEARLGREHNLERDCKARYHLTFRHQAAECASILFLLMRPGQIGDEWLKGNYWGKFEPPIQTPSLELKPASYAVQPWSGELTIGDKEMEEYAVPQTAGNFGLALASFVAVLASLWKYRRSRRTSAHSVLVELR